MTSESRTSTVSARVTAAVTLVTSKTIREISMPEASRSNSAEGSRIMRANISLLRSTSTRLATHASA